MHCHGEPGGANFLTAVTVHSVPLTATDDIDNAANMQNGVRRNARSSPSLFNSRTVSLNDVPLKSLTSHTQPLSTAQTAQPNASNNGASHYHSHCLIHNRCPHHSNQRHRCISVSSQATLQTSISRNQEDSNGGGGGLINANAGRMPCNQQNPTDNTASKVQLAAVTASATTTTTNGGVSATRRKAPAKTALGNIAEKLRRGTRKVLQFTSGSGNSSNSSNNYSSGISRTHADHHHSNGSSGCKAPPPSGASVSAMLTMPLTASRGVKCNHYPSEDAGNCGQQQRTNRIPKLQKHNSVDSDQTNTISNSSLQEVDAEEFDSAELTKHMGEINNEINALKCGAGGQLPVDSAEPNV